MSPPAKRQKLSTADAASRSTTANEAMRASVIRENRDEMNVDTRLLIKQVSKNMDKFTEAETEEAQKFMDFYIDMIDNHKDCFKYHLSESAVLDWFGQTVKGCKNVNSFLKSSTSACNHHFPTVRPVKQVGFRETHVINLPSPNKEAKVPNQYTEVETGDRTPPNPTTSTNSNYVERGQGDGMHNCLASPVKKSRVETEDVPMKYLIAEGFIEFRRKSSKKLQPETKWSRPCKLQVAYTQTSFEDCTMHLIIYEGNMKCRRNLMKDFDSSENE